MEFPRVGCPSSCGRETEGARGGPGQREEEADGSRADAGSRQTLTRTRAAPLVQAESSVSEN